VEEKSPNQQDAFDFPKKTFHSHAHSSSYHRLASNHLVPCLGMGQLAVEAAFGLVGLPHLQLDHLVLVHLASHTVTQENIKITISFERVLSTVNYV
jgi:hypothetical protein